MSSLTVFFFFFGGGGGGVGVAELMGCLLKWFEAGRLPTFLAIYRGGGGGGGEGGGALIWGSALIRINTVIQ